MESSTMKAPAKPAHQNKHEGGHPANEHVPDYGHPYEHALVRQLLRKMEKAGFILVGIDNGDDGMVKPKSFEHAMDEIFAVDDSHIYFDRDRVRWWVRLINGNRDSMISDYSLHAESLNLDAEFEAVIDDIDVKYI